MSIVHNGSGDIGDKRSGWDWHFGGSWCVGARVVWMISYMAPIRGISYL